MPLCMPDPRKPARHSTAFPPSRLCAHLPQRTPLWLRQQLQQWNAVARPWMSSSLPLPDFLQRDLARVGEHQIRQAAQSCRASHRCRPPLNSLPCQQGRATETAGLQEEGEVLDSRPAFTCSQTPEQADVRAGNKDSPACQPPASTRRLVKASP